MATVAILISSVIMWALSGVHGLDLSVYRAAAQAFLGMTPQELYDPKLLAVDNGTFLPFTYPPFAVLLFVPYAFMPLPVASVAHTAMLIAVTWGSAYLLLRNAYGLRMAYLRSGPVASGMLVAVVGLALGLAGPWRESASFGQINQVLLFVVLLDMLTRSSKLPHGLLTGVAAGVKLTPLAFGLIFVVEKDWKALRKMGIGFFSTVCVGFIVARQESVYYWTTALFDTTRVGDLSIMYNLSLRSLVERLGLPSSTVSIIWLILVVATILLGAWAIKSLLGNDDRISAVGVNGIVMLLISPISWFHHWVWIFLLLPALLGLASTPETRIRDDEQGRKRKFVSFDFMTIWAIFTWVIFSISSFTLTIAAFGEIRGRGPLWMESIASTHLLVAALCVFLVVRRAEAGRVESNRINRS